MRGPRADTHEESMSTDTIALIGTLLASAVTATWVLRSKLGSIETALESHAASDAANFKELGNKVIKLEGRTKRR